MFGTLKSIIIDEAHALAGTKRGDQLALCIARLKRLAPDHRRIGLSATVYDPQALGAWLAPPPVRIVEAVQGPDPQIDILETAGPPPWSGMGGRYAAPAVMDAIKSAQTTPAHRAAPWQSRQGYSFESRGSDGGGRAARGCCDLVS